MVSPIHLVQDRIRGFKTALGLTYRFRGELYPHWRALLGAFLCSIAYTATRLAEPWPLKFIFDNVLAGRPLHTPLPWINRALGGEPMMILAVSTGAILGLAALRGVFYYYQNVLAGGVGQEVVLKVRSRVFAHLQRLSLRFHARSSIGDLVTRLTSDIQVLRELLVASLVSLLSESIILVGFLAVMLVMEWRLSLVALLAIPAIFGLLGVYAARIRAATREQRRREGRLASRVQQVLAGIHVVQMFAREADEDERLGNLNQRSLRSGLRTTRLEAELNRAVELALAVATAATLWFGTLQVLDGHLTPGELIVFVSYMQSFYRPLRRISRVAERAGKANSCAERVTDVLEQAPDVHDGWRQAPTLHGAIRFEGVSFAYSADAPVLRGIDLDVQPGQTVALIGATGAGKSTLVSLVPRLYDPTGGVVRIDGHDIREFTLKSLRDQISVVPQDGMLFGGDIRENIAYGWLDASDQEIEAAARAAQIHQFIASLPDGYATTVGERGVTLSGGQRQRLALARAIVRDTPIVLLDEPTTGLDAESERLVVAALARLLEGRTAIVIAHRLSTVRDADVILVMHEGRIAERGRHEELLEHGGLYRKLYELQFAPQARSLAHAAPAARLAR